MSHSAADGHKLRPTNTVEDYLMVMQVMERDSGEIIAARLAEMLNVTPATVAMTLKRMERDNWITGTGRKSVFLTEVGRAAAHSVIRRHMLTEWLLVRIFNIPLSETHDEAHNIEHAISPRLEERMREILGNPAVCPHGNPFPGQEAATETWVALTCLREGDEGIIRRIHEFAEDNQEMLKYLVENGIVPGAKITLLRQMVFNQTLTISVAGHEVMLGFSAARFVFAEKTGEETVDHQALV